MANFGAFGDPFRANIDPLGPFWGYFWIMLGPFWDPLRSFGTDWVPFGIILEHSGSFLLILRPFGLFGSL